MRIIYIDGDACPVKEEVYRVAARHHMPVFLVTSLPMRAPDHPGITFIQVETGPDAADDWIAESAGAADVCITDDIPLASRCIKKGAVALTNRGKVLHGGNIGEIEATRDLLERLRSDGTLSEGAAGGPKPFTKKDRSEFLQNLELTVRKLPKE